MCFCFILYSYKLLLMSGYLSLPFNEAVRDRTEEVPTKETGSEALVPSSLVGGWEQPT